MNKHNPHSRAENQTAHPQARDWTVPLPAAGSAGARAQPTASLAQHWVTGGADVVATLDYQRWYERAPVAYCTLDAAGRIVQLNRRAATLLHSPAEQLLGQSFLRLVEPSNRMIFADQLSQLLRSEHAQTSEVALLLPDQTVRHLHVEAVGETDATGQQHCLLVLLDLAHIRHENQALATSERKFRELFEHSTDAAVLMQDERFVDCNAAALTLLAATNKQQLLGRSPWELAPPQQRPGVPSERYFRESVAEALRLGSKRCEGILCRLNGQLLWAEAILTPITDGNTSLLHVVWRDITAIKQQERLHQEKQARLQLLQETTRIGFWTWDLRSNLFEVDAYVQACLGWLPGSASQASFEALHAAVHPDDASRTQLVLTQAQERGFLPRYTFRILWPDGSVHLLATRAILSSDEFGRPLRMLGVLEAL
jgi:PAS domain S-box-containing protein